MGIKEKFRSLEEEDFKNGTNVDPTYVFIDLHKCTDSYNCFVNLHKYKDVFVNLCTNANFWIIYSVNRVIAVFMGVEEIYD